MHNSGHLQHRQRRNENQKHAKRADAHARSTIPIGLAILQCPYDQPKANHEVKLDASSDFRPKTHMEQVINECLKSAPRVPLMPQVNEEMRSTCPPGEKWHTKSVLRPIAKISPLGEPDVSMVEMHGKENEPLWEERVKKYREWYQNNVARNNWIWSSGGTYGQSSDWNKGIQKRGASAPPGRCSDQNGRSEEDPLPWRRLPDPNASEDLRL